MVTPVVHWLHAPRALLELDRVLRTGGHPEFIGNERRETASIRELDHATRGSARQPDDDRIDVAEVVIVIVIVIEGPTW